MPSYTSTTNHQGVTYFFLTCISNFSKSVASNIAEGWEKSLNPSFKAILPNTSAQHAHLQPNKITGAQGGGQDSLWWE